MRRVRRQERITTLISREWNSLSQGELVAIEYVYSRGKITTKEFSTLIERSLNRSKDILSGLCESEIFNPQRTSVNDPFQYYEIRKD